MLHSSGVFLWQVTDSVMISKINLSHFHSAGTNAPLFRESQIIQLKSRVPFQKAVNENAHREIYAATTIAAGPAGLIGERLCRAAGSIADCQSFTWLTVPVGTVF